MAVLDYVTRVEPFGIQINPKSSAYGAMGNGTNDDTAEILLAIESAKSFGAGLFFPPGNYKISGLLFEDFKGLVVQGSGASLDSLKGTRFIWDGNTTDPALRVFGCRDCIFENFTIVSSSAKPLAIAVQSETRSGSGSTANTYRHIMIQGTDLNGLGRGFKYIAGTGGDANNAENVFQHVNINNYSTYGWDFQHGQSTTHRFYAIGASAAALSTTSAGINSVAGVTYQIYGGNLNGNTEADIIWGGANHGLTLVGVFSETSSRFLKTTVSPSSTAPVTIIGGSWNTTNLHADGRVIDFQQRGPLSIEGWSVVGNPATAAAIYFDAGANGTWNFSLKNCLLTTSLTPTTMFTQDQPNLIENCVFAGASNVLVPFKTNNADSTPSFATLGVGTDGHANPTPAIFLVDGRQRIREGGGVTRYRADYSVNSTGLVVTVYDDTGAVYKSFIVASNTFEVWPGAVQANRVQVDANGNLQLVAATGTVLTPLLQVGGGTSISKIRTYAASLTPAAVAANTSAEETFTVAGLTTADKVTVNGPAPTAGTGIVNARVSAADTLALTFGNFTAGSLTPTSGTYLIVAVRS